MNNTFNISPTLLVAHLHFCHYTIPTQKNTKEQPSQRTKTDHNGQTNTTEKQRPITRVLVAQLKIRFKI
ncbi:hypothetical protein, partial [Flavobacterium psychrophilum]|uniref:hypothetical protein n=1 Tax=Flavobacterium psychrophilum TaxID=96345 RepID=UPI0012472728